MGTLRWPCTPCTWVASCAKSLLRTIAPIFSPPSVVLSTLSSGRLLISTMVVGRSTCSFIRSIKVVPPATNFTPAAAPMPTAPSMSLALLYLICPLCCWLAFYLVVLVRRCKIMLVQYRSLHASDYVANRLADVASSLCSHSKSRGVAHGQQT